jgi:hypothetical protein
LDQWLARNPDGARIETVHAFIREHCPEWTKCLVKE